MVAQLVVGLKSFSLMSMQSVCVSASTTDILELDEREHLEPRGDPEFVRCGLFLAVTVAVNVVVVCVTESVAALSEA